jgi:hypothetical protein
LTSVLSLITSGFSIEKALASDSFVDSVGVNVHLSYTDTLYYSSFPLVQSSLLQLGVRHLRDGLIDTQLQAYYDRLNQLGQLGIKGDFISSPGENTTLLQVYPSRVASSFESYEGPNEYDNSGQSNWASTLQTSVSTLYPAAKSGLQPTAPVLAPSLSQPGSFAILGNISSEIDYANLHYYPGGRNPGTPGWGSGGYGSIPWALGLAAQDSGTRPVMVTETGYDNLSSYADSVPEDVAAIYYPRLLLELWKAGIERSYMYELLSVSGDDYGLLRSDGSTKPAFFAVSNLLSLLSDPGTSFTPGSLDYTLTGGDANLHHELLQKADGSFYLALWVELPVYDVNAQQYLTVAPETVTLQTARPLSTLAVYQWNSAGQVTSQTLPPTTQQLTVTDHLQIVKLTLAQAEQLSVQVQPTTGGSVAMNPPSADNTYPSNSVVTLTATPKAGFAFSGYTGAASTPNNIVDVTTSSNMTVVANFACTLTVTPAVLSLPAGAGSTTVSVTTGTGCSVPLSSTASWMSVAPSTLNGSGSVQVSYTANSSSQQSASLTVGTQTIAVTQAAAATIPVTFTSAVLGTTIAVDGVAITTPSTLHWTAGASHTFSAVSPQTFGGNVYVLDNGWAASPVGISSTALTQTVAPTVAETYYSRMKQAVKLNWSVIGNGSLSFSLAPTNGYYILGKKFTVTAVPAKGCTLQGFTGNAISVINGASVGVVIVAPTSTVTATFTCP